jgi:uncharacterized membrane protein
MSTPPAQLTYQVYVHFYRAVVGHMDVWRQRMDATTNWSAATTAAMVTFSFSSADSPHFVLLLALAFNLMFLLMESRRYQVFDLWRRRFRQLNRFMIAPVLAPRIGPDEAESQAALERVAADLGRTVPHLSLFEAAGYRIRRNYAYVVGVTLMAWLLKLEVHPTAATELGDLVRRAEVGQLQGPYVMVLIGLLLAVLVVLAVRAPSDQMLNWAPLPGVASRWIRRRGASAAPDADPPPPLP